MEDISCSSEALWDSSVDAREIIGEKEIELSAIDSDQ